MTKCTKGDANWDVGRRMWEKQAADDPGRHRLESQPSSRTGENPPYGMRGGIEETSASFEARSAPRSYPTKVEGVADKAKGTAKGTAKDIHGKQPEPTFDKPLGSSHNDEADLRDVVQEAAKRSK